MNDEQRFKKLGKIRPWLSMTDSQIENYVGMWVVLDIDEDCFYCYIDAFYDYRLAQELANKIDGFYCRF